MIEVPKVRAGMDQLVFETDAETRLQQEKALVDKKEVRTRSALLLTPFLPSGRRDTLNPPALHTHNTFHALRKLSSQATSCSRHVCVLGALCAVYRLSRVP
jgi:hypothetical protein